MAFSLAKGVSFEQPEQRAWNNKFGRTQCNQFPLDKERPRELAQRMVQQWDRRWGSLDTDERVLCWPLQRPAPKKEERTPTESESRVLKGDWSPLTVQERGNGSPWGFPRLLWGGSFTDMISMWVERGAETTPISHSPELGGRQLNFSFPVRTQKFSQDWDKKRGVWIPMWLQEIWQKYSASEGSVVLTWARGGSRQGSGTRITTSEGQTTLFWLTPTCPGISPSWTLFLTPITHMWMHKRHHP